MGVKIILSSRSHTHGIGFLAALNPCDHGGYHGAPQITIRVSMPRRNPTHTVGPGMSQGEVSWEEERFRYQPMEAQSGAAQCGVRWWHLLLTWTHPASTLWDTLGNCSGKIRKLSELPIVHQFSHTLAPSLSQRTNNREKTEKDFSLPKDESPSGREA